MALIGKPPDWDKSRELYNKDSHVTYQDSTWVAIRNVDAPNVVPSDNSAYWRRLVPSVAKKTPEDEIADHIRKASEPIPLDGRLEFNTILDALVTEMEQRLGITAIRGSDLIGQFLAVNASIGAYNNYSVDGGFYEGTLATAQLASSIRTIIAGQLGVRQKRKSPPEVDVILQRETNDREALKYGLTVEAYNSFLINGYRFFNREPIVFDAVAAPTEKVQKHVGRTTLHQGELRLFTTGEYRGEGFPWIIVREPDFGISDTDVRVDILRSPPVILDVVKDPIWMFRNHDNVPQYLVEDYTTDEGYLLLRFGNRDFAVDPTGDTVRVVYAVTLGSAARNIGGIAGADVTLQTDGPGGFNILGAGGDKRPVLAGETLNTRITGTVQTQVTGGGDELPAETYRNVGPHFFSSRNVAVDINGFNSVPLLFPNVSIIACKVVAPAEYAPNDVKFANIMKVSLLGENGAVLNEDRWNEFVEWMRRGRSLYSAQFMQDDPIGVPYRIHARVGAAQEADTSLISRRAEDAIRGLFRIKSDSVGLSIYGSDMIEAIRRSAPGVQWVEILEPTGNIITGIDPVQIKPRFTAKAVTEPGRGLPDGAYSWQLSLVSVRSFAEEWKSGSRYEQHQVVKVTETDGTFTYWSANSTIANSTTEPSESTGWSKTGEGIRSMGETLPYTMRNSADEDETQFTPGDSRNAELKFDLTASYIDGRPGVYGYRVFERFVPTYSKKHVGWQKYRGEDDRKANTVMSHFYRTGDIAAVQINTGALHDIGIGSLDDDFRHSAPIKVYVAAPDTSDDDVRSSEPIGETSLTELAQIIARDDANVQNIDPTNWVADTAYSMGDVIYVPYSYGNVYYRARRDIPQPDRATRPALEGDANNWENISKPKRTVVLSKDGTTVTFARRTEDTSPLWVSGTDYRMGNIVHVLVNGDKVHWTALRDIPQADRSTVPSSSNPHWRLASVTDNEIVAHIQVPDNAGNRHLLLDGVFYKSASGNDPVADPSLQANSGWSLFNYAADVTDFSPGDYDEGDMVKQDNRVFIAVTNPDNITSTSFNAFLAFNLQWSVVDFDYEGIPEFSNSGVYAVNDIVRTEDRGIDAIWRHKASINTEVPSIGSDNWELYEENRLVVPVGGVRELNIIASDLSYVWPLTGHISDPLHTDTSMQVFGSFSRIVDGAIENAGQNAANLVVYYFQRAHGTRNNFPGVVQHLASNTGSRQVKDEDVIAKRTWDNFGSFYPHLDDASLSEGIDKSITINTVLERRADPVVRA